jgi:hypothetical protein
MNGNTFDSRDTAKLTDRMRRRAGEPHLGKELSSRLLAMAVPRTINNARDAPLTSRYLTFEYVGRCGFTRTQD